MKRARIKYENGRYVVETNKNGEWKEIIGIEGEKDDGFTLTWVGGVKSWLKSEYTFE